MEQNCCDTEGGKLNKITDVTLSALCKALGHSARIQLMRVLIEKGSCICGDLAEEVSLAQSTISEHLRILKTAGLIQGTIDGPRRCYCVNKETLSQLEKAFKVFCKAK